MTNHYPNEQDALANLRRKYEALTAERDKLKEALRQISVGRSKAHQAAIARAALTALGETEKLPRDFLEAK